MGVIYSVSPYSKLFQTDEVLEWLEDSGVSIPADAQFGREATLNELKEVLLSFTDCQIEFTVTSLLWRAYLRCGNESLEIRTFFSGNADEEHDFSFDGSERYIVMILEKLAKVCGTFILLSNGEDPQFITGT
jgi:hypothetical protein